MIGEILGEDKCAVQAFDVNKEDVVEPPLTDKNCTIQLINDSTKSTCYINPWNCDKVQGEKDKK